MPEANKPSAPRPRIEGLSDIVFGLAISIGAIQFVASLPQTQMQVVAAIAAFAFSFLIIINFWNQYTTIVSAAPIETRLMLRLNMLLLFLIAVEPYLFNILVIQHAAYSALGDSVSAYFALDIGGINFVLAYLANTLTREEKNLIPSEIIPVFRLSRNTMMAIGLAFFISAIPFFWYTQILQVPLRIWLWVFTIPFSWVTQLFIWPRKKTAKSPT